MRAALARNGLMKFKENVKWDKVFKNGPIKNCGRQPLKNLKDMICLNRPYPFNFLKAVFHKIYLVHSRILCFICLSVLALWVRWEVWRLYFKIWWYLTIWLADFLIYSSESLSHMIKMTWKYFSFDCTIYAWDFVLLTKFFSDFLCVKS